MNNYMNYNINDMFMKDFMMPAADNMVQNDNTFVNAEEGFLRGNLEMGTYVPYKNMTFIRPQLTDDRQKKLYEIQKNGFAAHDINLYLDTHPDDANAIMLYKRYLDKEKQLTSEFEKKYGPIELSDGMFDMSKWSWINEPWPWNK